MQPPVQADPGSWATVESPDFAVRLGRLLTTTRRRARTSIGRLAASDPTGFSAAQLTRFELGTLPLDEEVVEALGLLYEADLGRVLPPRLPVAITEGRLSGAGVSVEFSPGDATSLMLAYLSLIRQMRHQKKVPAIALRRDDVLVLAGYLDMDGADVVRRLSSLMNLGAAQRTTMSMLFAAGAIVIGLAAGGHASADEGPNGIVDGPASDRRELVAGELSPDLPVVDEPVVGEWSPDLPVVDELVVTDGTATDAVAVEPALRATVAPLAVSPPPATSSTTAPMAEVVSTPTPTPSTEPRPVVEPVPPPSSEAGPVVEPSTVVVIDRAADVGGSSTAHRVRVPSAAPPVTVASEAPPRDRSGCNPDPSEAVMSVVIPDIGYSCPVYVGGQPMIDAGFVTLVTDVGSNPALATRPGRPGTLWLAGHRTTHGAAFADVPTWPTAR